MNELAAKLSPRELEVTRLYATGMISMDKVMLALWYMNYEKTTISKQETHL